MYFFALVVCGFSRILLKLYGMDLESGFYSTGYAAGAWLVPLFSTVLFLSLAGLFVVNRLRRAAGDYPVSHSSRVAGILAMLVGAAMIAFVLLEQPYTELEQNYSDTLLHLRDYAHVVLGCLGGLSLLWIGLDAAVRGKIGRAAMLPALFSSIWQVYSLITRFNSYTVVTSISDNLLAVLFMVFASLFLVGHARTIFGLTRKDGRNYTLFSGLGASLAGLLLVVPNYVFMAAYSLEMPAPMLGMWESVYIGALSVYSLVFVCGMVRSIGQV